MTARKTSKQKKDSKTKAKSQSIVDARDLSESSPEQVELPEMETIKNPHLERKAREIADVRTRMAKLKEKESGLEAEALHIMHEHEISHYNKNGVVLNIDLKEKLKVAVD